MRDATINRAMCPGCGNMLPRGDDELGYCVLCTQADDYYAYGEVAAALRFVGLAAREAARLHATDEHIMRAARIGIGGADITEVTDVAAWDDEGIARRYAAHDRLATLLGEAGEA